MSGANIPVEIQATQTLTASLVDADLDVAMGHADQVVVLVEYVNVDADSMEMQVQTASIDTNVALVDGDFYNETLENEDKLLGLGKIVNKLRQFTRPATGATYRFSMIIPVTEDFLRIQFKETLGGGASFGTIRLIVQANYVGRP